MYKAFTALWSKPLPSSTSAINNSQLASDTFVDEDGWVLVSDTEPKVITSNDNHNSMMTNSWIASPPLMRTDHSPSTNRSSSPNTHHFNPIENLLIEHASMSVYEQIASRTRTRRQRKSINDQKLDEQIEGNNDDEDDDDERSSVILQYPLQQHRNASSIQHRNLNVSLIHSTNSSISTLESSTSSLVAHHRHLNRIHQRRRRSSKRILTNSITNEKVNPTFNKIIDRQRFNYARTPKLVLHQPSRSNH